MQDAAITIVPSTFNRRPGYRMWVVYEGREAGIRSHIAGFIHARPTGWNVTLWSDLAGSWTPVDKFWTRGIAAALFGRAAAGAAREEDGWTHLCLDDEDDPE